MAMMDLSGETIGGYFLESRIGQGGMAAVYRAVQKSVDRVVAVKVLASALAADPSFAERFEREARVIAKLEHPYIVPLIDYGTDQECAYMVMRYLEGGTLAERMAREQLTLAEIDRLLAQVCSALDYAHERDIIHRDIKPNNILLDQIDNAYLADFGIAKMVASTSLTSMGILIGTPTYMAPEQGQGLQVDARTDVYALGVTLYALLTGRAPFEAESTPALLHQHSFKAPPPPRSLAPDLPDAVEAVVLKALAKDPNARYQSAGELAAAFTGAVKPVDDARTIVFDEPGKTSTPPASKPPTQPPIIETRTFGESPTPPQRAGGRVWLMLGILGVVAIAALVIFILATRGSTPQEITVLSTATLTAPTTQTAIAPATSTQAPGETPGETLTATAESGPESTATGAPEASPTDRAGTPASTPAQAATAEPSAAALAETATGIPATATATATATPSHTEAPTGTATPTLTHTATATPSETATITASPTVTFTPTASPTATLTPTPTPTPTPTTAPTATPILPVVCDGAPPARMQSGYAGHNAPGNLDATVVRQTPGGKYVGDLGPRETFDVIGGPECASIGEVMYTWWQIEVHGRALTGWIPEGITGDYWVEPVCAPAPEARMRVGYQGRTNPNDFSTTMFRDKPAGKYLGELSAGATFDVLAGPQCARLGNVVYTWWFVRVHDQNVAGWLPEGVTGGYWIEPLDLPNEQ
ncbi:MAG: protein kinase [Anaerolineae bacterium]|nr:protein kinase [Anaerolineae bacterium]